jgi:uncharacterized protein YndB with AHSA1/START domain
MNQTNTDRIERSVVLRAPRHRVWNALADARQFGQWFGVALDGDFIPGQRVQGQITKAGYTHVRMDIVVETVEPERALSWRWHPAAIEPGVDYSHEPSTLVEFTLEEAPGGTKLTVVESGFDRLPVERREIAFRSNDGGWARQLEAITAYVAKAA